jgi:hypothetical protein
MKAIGINLPGRLTEIFNLPYVFGSQYLKDGQENGPMTRFGSDCANFLIYGLRRGGAGISWGDVRHLASHLKIIENSPRVEGDFILGSHGSIRISQSQINRGLFIVCNAHALAVYENRSPSGQLGIHDLVIHHLGGYPEIIELGTALKSQKDFRVMCY